MNKIIPALALFLMVGFLPTASAQETQTLISGDVSHGGFGAPVMKISDIDGTPGVWTGARGGWIINMNNSHSLSLGVGGYGLVTEHEIPEPDPDLDPDEEYYALNGYGGFEVEYTNSSNKLVHMTLTSLIGGGGLMTRDEDFSEVDDRHDPYFVFEPGANIEVNVTNFFRISAGVGYLLTSGLDRAGFNDEDFTGINGSLTLKFGKF